MINARAAIRRSGGIRPGLGWLFSPPALLFGAFVVVPLAALTWRASGKGKHTLRAVVTDARGRTATAARAVRVGCA